MYHLQLYFSILRTFTVAIFSMHSSFIQMQLHHEVLQLVFINHINDVYIHDKYTGRLSTVGLRSFPVAAATLWNTLPVNVQSSPSLPLFRQRLKTFLFHKSFPDVVWQADYAFVDLVMAYCYLATLKIS